MTIVSTRDFRANQTKYLSMADRGEHVVLRSRRGRYRLMPVEDEEELEAPRHRDLTAEICRGLQDFRAYLDGDTTRMRTLDEFLDELRNSDN